MKKSGENVPVTEGKERLMKEEWVEKEGFLAQTRRSKRLSKKLWIDIIIKASEKTRSMTRRSWNSKRWITARHVLKHFRAHGTAEHYVHEMKIVLGGLMYMSKYVSTTVSYNRPNIVWIRLKEQKEMSKIGEKL